MQNLKNTVKINEVDCYIGNACTTKYATASDVQHQILVNNQPLGFLNGPADAGRYERVVVEKEVSKEFIDLFNKCVELKKTLKSEHCSTIEEYNQAAKLNKPTKDLIQNYAEKMWEIESLDLSFKTFFNILDY